MEQGWRCRRSVLGSQGAEKGPDDDSRGEAGGRILRCGSFLERSVASFVRHSSVTEKYGDCSTESHIGLNPK